MAQLTYNTMRFGTDNFSFAVKQAMLVPKEPLNPTKDYTHIKNFAVEYSQPTGSSIRFLHRVVHDDTDVVRYFYGHAVERLCKFEDLASYDFDTLFEKANTIDEMLAISDHSTYAGYDFYPIILLEGTEDAIPKVKFSAVFENREEVLDKSKSGIFSVDTYEMFKLLDMTKPDVTISGGADYSFTVQFADENENWSDPIPWSKVRDHFGENVKHVKVHENFHVDAINRNNSVTRTGFGFVYSYDTNGIVFGDTADLYTVTKNYYLPLKYCAVIVKHEDLNGAQLKAFAKFDPCKYGVTKKAIGTGTGESQTIILPNSKFTDVNSIKIYAGDEQIDFEFLSADNSVTFTAPAGAAITATYTYNLQIENWIELTADPTQHDFSDGLFTTRYHCSDVKKYGDNVMVSAIRLQFIRGENGNVPRVHGFTAGWAV